MLAGWLRIPITEPNKLFNPSLTVSVVIPVRNEDRFIERLIEDLSKQTYPKNLFEVIVVNDHSNDETINILERLKNKPNVDIIVQDSPGIGKKEAIESGIQVASGEIIVTTDGDCRVQPNWLREISFSMEEYNAVMIAGPVRFRNTETIWNQGLMMEFAALQGTGASTMHFNVPTMCNGANIAYFKKVFLEVQGFEGNKDIPSGDDEFLMHRISKKYSGRIHYLKSREAIVETESSKDFVEWYNQRIRWASKWRGYEIISPQFIALIIILINLNLIFGLALWLTGTMSVAIYLAVLGIKSIVDFIFVYNVNRFLKRRSSLIIQILIELIYPLYALSFGILGIFGNYTWKDRNSNFSK
jgi:cellulose synthase/poly-beta-1,6-N-acetylglucosamine synthase-like glycosyltransferase